MTCVTFIDADGVRYRVEAAEPMSLMELAITNEVPSIVGVCGGMCSCGTCHCYPSRDSRALPPAPDELEEDTLSHVLDRRPESRLACQIRVEPALEGLVVHLPPRQRIP
jgi:2Fe-2S ferredoxin